MEKQGEMVMKKVLTVAPPRVLQLPIGFRFRPTDEEVVVHYLARKVLSLPLPANVIPDHPDVFRSNPLSLPGDVKEKRYFFTKRIREEGGKGSKIMTANSGYWKAVGEGKQITSARVRNAVVGHRKSWAFYQKSNDNNPHEHWFKTSWLMHEFQLVLRTRDGKVVIQDWVVCGVYEKNTKETKDDENNAPQHRNINVGTIDNPSVIDFKVENSYDITPPQPSSPEE